MDFAYYYLQTRNQFYKEQLFPKVPKRYFDFEQEKDKFVTTSRAVSFKNLPFGSNENEIVDVMGKPRFALKEPFPQFPIKVLFYKETLNNLRIISQLHLFNNRFFYGCYNILNWKHSDLVNYKEIILNKYLGKKKPVVSGGVNINEEKIIRLRDEENNHLLITAEIYLHVVYYCTRNEIADQFQHIQKIEEDKKFKSGKLANDFF